ncbi:nucleoside phosphorylase domain-containing protein [Aspergillus filifer]
MKINPEVEDYHVAWITALPIELSAATAMLDAEYEGSEDTASYTLGRVGRHNVVVVCLPAGQVGTSAAATTVAEIRAKFPTEADIRLGDVVISHPQRNHGGVVQYDFGKIGPGGRHIPTGFVNGPPRTDYLGEVLYRREDAVIHYGTIASGNSVIRDGETRDTLSREFGGILCFEMEAAGLLNILPCIAIRGICDYADSHKNKSWQPYAAGMAAACAKELLAYVPAFTSWKGSSPTIASLVNEELGGGR